MKLDVHAHFVPGGYREALLRTGHDHPDGMPWIPEWSAAEHVAAMDRLGVARALLSISSPGVHLGEGASAVDLAREVNEAGRRAVVDHPGRFGLLASLPLPDVDATMTEIAFCAEELRADGFVLMTNAGGAYLSDPSFGPILGELDRRSARVLLHPTSPACWSETSFERPRPMLEFLFDTTRTVVELTLSGALARHRALKLIIPHAGATLPLVADRIHQFARALAPDADVLGDLGRLHFDLAGTVTSRQLDALRTLTTEDHLHYGSDYPWTPEPVVSAAAKRIGALAPSLRSNSDALFPVPG